MDPATVAEIVAALVGAIAKLIEQGKQSGMTPAQMLAMIAPLQTQMDVTFAADDTAAKAAEAAKFPAP